METTLAAVYCEGWEAGLVNPFTPDQAESRDSVGEPYSVVLLAGGRPHTVLDISWAEGYFAVTRLDLAGRKVAAHELRRAPEGDLFLRVSSTGAGPEAARHRTTWQISGRRTDFIEPAGDRGGHYDLVDVAPPRLPIPSFGRWKPLLDRTARVHAEICTEDYRDACVIPRETEGPFRITNADTHGLPMATTDVRPWHPPRPMRPRRLDALFRNGAERSADERRLSVSTHPAGKLNLPSGRLVAADPSWLDDQEPFLATVEPGTYPVTISLATFTDDPEHQRVAAVRLDVTDRRPVTWELALREGQDPLDLGYGEFFGFAVETGRACLVDEDNLARLAGEADDLQLTGQPFRNHADGDLIAWSSRWGDGYYPIWIGRDFAGRATTFVADMLLLSSDG